MTKKNYKTGANRGNKLLNERGFPGQHFGPAGRVKHLNPTSIPQPEPTSRKIDLAYARYVARMRRDGCMPLPPTLWLRPKKSKRALSHPGKTPGSVSERGNTPGTQDRTRSDNAIDHRRRSPA